MIWAAGIRIGEYSLIWFKLLGTQMDERIMFVLESRVAGIGPDSQSGEESHSYVRPQIEEKIARVDKSHCNEF